MANESVTRVAIIEEAARRAGVLVYSGTATAGTASTLADTNVLLHANNDDLKGMEVYIHTGTGLGQARVISASTASTSLATVTPNWAVTPDNTSQYFVLRAPYRYQTFVDGADDAIRRIRHRKLFSKTNEEYVAQDLLWGYGAMERWTNGASSAGDGWTLDGNSSVAQSTTIADRMVNSAQVTSDGTNLSTYSRSVGMFAELHDESVSGYGWIRADVTSRATITITDGVTTNTADALTVANTWYEFGPGKDINLDSLSIDSNPTELTISCNISAGDAVVGLFDNVRLILDSKPLEMYELPASNGYGNELTSFMWLSEVWFEDAPGSWNYSHRARPGVDYAVVDREGTRFLWLRSPEVLSLRNHRLMLRGQEGPARLTADTSTTEVSARYMASFVADFAMRSTRGGLTNDEDIRRNTRLVGDWQEEDRLIRDKPYSNSIRVEAH